MEDQYFISQPYGKTLDKGSISTQSPSNIALIKYWGKHGNQLPQNASLSFTLSESYTQTTLFFEPKTNREFRFEVYLDEKHQPDFEPKILQFFERIEKYVPFITDYAFRIHTHNSFPHSSGIASSASGMSALALCLVELQKQMDDIKNTENYYLQKASFLARLGSGSACRSIEGPVVVWGKHPAVAGSSDLYGCVLKEKIHPVFTDYRDTILLVDQDQKEVSSSQGHSLMQGHPFAEVRFSQASQNLHKLLDVLQVGDVSGFIEIIESEALTLHAMMMTSIPYFILMKSNTLEIIKRIWDFRRETGSSVCFTLDAGANVHVLFPEREKETVGNFIKEELADFCQNRKFIVDSVGLGAFIKS
ncbi:MAG TPA: hypothetical protein VKZ42_05510 [Flavobacteriaceae bacterium]|nr:hypothetical protein [Flavobacteriaceae bacterium]